MARKKSSQSRESKSATAYFRLAEKASRAGDSTRSSAYHAKAIKLRDIAAKKKMAGTKATPASNIVTGTTPDGRKYSFKRNI